MLKAYPANTKQLYDIYTIAAQRRTYYIMCLLGRVTEWVDPSSKMNVFG